MKAKLYALGAICLSILIGIVSIFASRSRADAGKAEKFKNSLDESKMKLHKKAANEAFKKAKSHLKKAKEVEQRKERENSESAEEAIMEWNDDKL